MKIFLLIMGNSDKNFQKKSEILKKILKIFNDIIIGQTPLVVNRHHVEPPPP